MEKLYDGELLDEQFYGEIEDAIENLGSSSSSRPNPENGNQAEATTATLSKTSFDELSDVLPFNYETLPSAAAFVRDTSSRLNCPPEFIAISLLIAVSALIDSRIQICPMQIDKTWEVVPVLSGIAVAPSMRTKCPKLKAALQPLYNQSKTKHKKAQNESLEKSVYDFQQLVIESSHQFGKGKIKRVAKNEDGDIESIVRIENRFVQPSQFAQEENLNLMASVLEADLPGVLGKNQNSQLLGKFHLAVYPDICEWQFVDRAPNQEAVQLIAIIFARLDKWIKNQGKSPVVLDFSDDARDFYILWLKSHQGSLKDTEAHQGLLDHLAQFGKLFPALALVFFLVDAMANNEDLTPECTVGLTAVERAAGFCHLLDGHARRIYGIAVCPEIADARMILRKITEGRLTSGFARREICVNNLGGIKTAARAEKALALLVEHHYLRAEYVKLSDNSAKLAERYFIN